MSEQVEAAREWARAFRMDGEYPSEASVAALAGLSLVDYAACELVLAKLQSVWRWDDYFKRGPARRVKGHPDWAPRRKWRVSTGGWSGHEDLIEALRQATGFWALCFWSERRGGHYVFETRVFSDPEAAPDPLSSPGVLSEDPEGAQP